MLCWLINLELLQTINKGEKMKILVSFCCGFILCYLHFLLLAPNTVADNTLTEQSEQTEQTDMLKFLVQTESGHAINFKELPNGIYRVGLDVDKYNTILYQIVPLGDIPLLVRDVNKTLIHPDNNCISITPPYSKDW